MKFSSRAIYGMQAVLGLARRHGRGPTFLKDLAEAEGLPAGYLEQQLSLLRRSGIVQAVRGARGGYSLARKPSEITVLAVLVALEGPLVLAECPTGSGCCGNPEICALQELWAEGTRALNATFGAVSLADMVERHPAKDGEVLVGATA